MAEDYSTWAYEDLVEEIRREEESLALLRSGLAEARARLSTIERAIREERLPLYEERYRRRSLRIAELEEDIARWSDAIRRRTVRVEDLELRIKEREVRVEDLELRIKEREESIRELERRISDRARRIAALDRQIRELDIFFPRSPTIPIIRRRITSLLGWQTRERRSLRTYRGWQTRELRRLRAYRGWQTRELRRLRAYRSWQTRQGRYREHAYAERRGYLRWQVEEEPLVRRLEELRVSQQFWQEEIPSLELDISAEEERLKRKRAALPRLHRVKIRLYAVREDPERPQYYLTFQGFFDIDAILDARTGLPIWDWWLTEEEIEYAKYHFHGYWKGGVDNPKPFDVPDIRQAYLTEDGGIALPESLEAIPQFKHHKNIPQGYLNRAANMTLREIIVGISNIKPRPTDEPEGVFFEYALIVDEEGAIKWMDNRDRYVWTPPQDVIDRVKEELGLG